MIENSKAIGVPDVCSAKDITSNNTKVNTLFVAESFNTFHGLPSLGEPAVEEDKEDNKDDSLNKD